MNTNQQFWWNWAVSALTAAGTIGAAWTALFIALFGNALRQRLLPPKLFIKLSDAPGEGEKAKAFLSSGTETVSMGGTIVSGGPRETVSRWYHVKVENQRQAFVTATEVRLWMLELRVRNAAGDWITDWIGELPFAWKDQQVKLPGLQMGQPDEADLCHIVRDYFSDGKHLLQLSPAIAKQPPETEWSNDCHIQVKFQARSIEARSNIITVQIDWNGQWDHDDARMGQYVQVKEV
jgi:hypothetical protein